MFILKKKKLYFSLEKIEFENSIILNLISHFFIFIRGANHLSIVHFYPILLVLLKNLKIPFRLFLHVKPVSLYHNFCTGTYIYIYIHNGEPICKPTIRETQRLTIG